MQVRPKQSYLNDTTLALLLSIPNATQTPPSLCNDGTYNKTDLVFDPPLFAEWRLTAGQRLNFHLQRRPPTRQQFRYASRRSELWSGCGWPIGQEPCAELHWGGCSWQPRAGCARKRRRAPRTARNLPSQLQGVSLRTHLSSSVQATLLPASVARELRPPQSSSIKSRARCLQLAIWLTSTELTKNSRPAISRPGDASKNERGRRLETTSTTAHRVPDTFATGEIRLVHPKRDTTATISAPGTSSF